MSRPFLELSIAPISPSPSPGPSQSPSIASSPGAIVDNASALPNWLLMTILAMAVLIIIAMFALTAYSLSAPRSTLKNILGQGSLRKPPASEMVSQPLVKELATSARGGRRTTRTTLAIGGFSLLGVIIVAMFGLSGEGVRDLRSQVVASVTTLVAAIAGFYFGAQTVGGGGNSPTAQASSAAPRLAVDPLSPRLKVGSQGTYAPALSGTPAPTVSLAEGSELPAGLSLNASSGAVSGVPTAAGEYSSTLVARNGVNPDAVLTITLSVDA